MGVVKNDWVDVSETGGVPVAGVSQMSASDYNTHAGQTNANTADIVDIQAALADPPDISADAVIDGTTNKSFTAVERTKLASFNMPGAASTPTAGGTTTLTVTSNYTQVFTGTLDQNCVLPTTSVPLGMAFRIDNQSFGTITIKSSDGTPIGTLFPGGVADVTAAKATPTGPQDWGLGYECPLPLVVTGALHFTTAARDGDGNLTANAHIAGFVATASSAGTLTLLVGSAQVQNIYGTTTHTVALPTTNVTAGMMWRIINTSSGVVTINSSGGNLVKSLAAGAAVWVTALVATPTTALHWHAG